MLNCFNACINTVDSTPNESIIRLNMTIKEAKKLEKIANESMRYARKAITKSNEVHAILSLMEAKMGKVKQYSSVDEIFKKLKI